ncbi:response regulator [Massilia glaciei]|uniref:Response regulator n=2 Tax=Massilia glaciei TaxID=1524097 RepID=A0A2U2HG18_9BURK|nr:response regulator [Massilia glaciei]
MLLLWGREHASVNNAAHAALAAGGALPDLPPAPLAAAWRGQPQRVAAGAFELYLTPLREDETVSGVLCSFAAAPADTPAPAPATARLRVLVVEDNIDSQYLVCEMLKAFGHDADGVGSAEQALPMLPASAYDVLFTDVSLPGMSGVELARQAIAAQPSLHVVFASGYGGALLRHVEFPFVSLQKPYEIEQLQAALAAFGPAG